MKESAHTKLCELLSDSVPEVRAAAAYALGTFIGTDSEKSDPERDTIELNVALTLKTITQVKGTSEASPLVRKEVLFALHQLARSHRVNMCKVMRLEESKKEDKKEALLPLQCDLPKDQQQVYTTLYKHLLFMQRDPHPLVASAAVEVVDMLKLALKESAPSSSPVSDGRSEQWSLKNFLSPKHEKKRSLHESFSVSISDIPAHEISEKSHVQHSFYEWSIQFLRRSILSPDRSTILLHSQPDPSDPTEVAVTYRKNKLRKALEKASLLGGVKTCKLEHQIAITHGKAVTSLLFHPTEPLLLSASSKHSSVHIWKFPGDFSTEANVLAPVSSLSFAEPLYSDRVVVGGVDGCLRVFHSLSSSPSLLTSFRVFPKSSILHTHICHRSHLATAGAYPFLRIWDVEKEYSVDDVKTGTSVAITSITSGMTDTASHLIVAGFANGTVRLFDSRVSEKSVSAVQTYGTRLEHWSEHTQSIVSVSMPKFANIVVSGAADGVVKLWETRMQAKDSYKTINTGSGGMTAFSSHNYAPILSCGYRSQKIVTTNFEGEVQSHIKYRVGFLEERIGSNNLSSNINFFNLCFFFFLKVQYLLCLSIPPKLFLPLLQQTTLSPFTVTSQSSWAKS